MAKKKKDGITYEQAIQELADIQLALENNEISIDQLTEKVKRANELVQFCREKLRGIESDLEDLSVI